MTTLAKIKSGEINRTPTGEITTPGARAWVIYADKDTNVLMGEYLKDSTWPNHEHTSSIEHLICVDGQFDITFELPEGMLKIVLERGDGVKIPTKVLHSVYSRPGGKMVAVCIPPEKAY